MQAPPPDGGIHLQVHGFFPDGWISFIFNSSPPSLPESLESLKESEDDVSPPGGGAPPKSVRLGERERFRLFPGLPPGGSGGGSFPPPVVPPPIPVPLFSPLPCFWVPLDSPPGFCLSARPFPLERLSPLSFACYSASASISSWTCLRCRIPRWNRANLCS